MKKTGKPETKILISKDPRTKSIEKIRPEIVEELIFKLANPADLTTRTKLSQFYQVTTSEIYRFIKRNKKQIDIVNEKILADDWDNIGERYKVLATLAIERTKEMLPTANAKDASIIAQIATDKVILLESKGVKQISILHEHRHSLADVSKILLEESNRRKLVDKPQVIDVKITPEEDKS